MECLRHAKFLELSLSGLNGIFDGFMADEDAQFAGGPRFRVPNRGDDIVVLELMDEILRLHGYQLPLAPPPPKLPPPPEKPPPPENPPLEEPPPPQPPP